MKPLTSWSYSRWDKYTTCPLMFKLEVLEGRKAPPNAAMERGQKVHEELSAYLSKPWSEPEPAPAAAGKQAALVEQIATFPRRVVEQQWGFTRQWAPTDWFGSETWLRSIVDVGVLYDDMTVEVVDWKTGKPRGTHDDQMEIFAVSVMAKYPEVRHVTTRLAYIDFDKTEFGEYPAADFDKLKAKWEEKVRPMFEDTAFLPRPNDKCRLCAFSRSSGGECRYG